MTRRPIRIEGGIAYVPLTRGYEAIIDADDVPIVQGRNWCITQYPGQPSYATTNTIANGKRTTLKMHRLIMGHPIGEVDHRDGDGLNNRRSNLRIATRSQNECNKGVQKNNTSGFRGVSFFKPHGKWKAQIVLNGKARHLGYFATPEEAHAAYVAAQPLFHGEFARIAAQVDALQQDET